MAELNFNLLRQEGPKNLYEGFEQGRQAAAQNALAQQETAQNREFNNLRKQQIVSQMRTSEQTQNRELVTQRTQQYRDRLLRAGTPDAVRNLIRQRHADPILGPATLAFGSLDDDLAEVPDDVTAFQDYLSREAMGAAEFIKFTQEGRSISQIMGGGGGAAAPAAAPAPAAPSQMNLPAGVQPETMGRVPGVVTSPVLDATPMNAMMPAPMTAAPLAPVNALRPPAAGLDVAEMRRQRDGLLLMGGPRAKALADKLQLDITAATTATSSDIKTMEALGYPVTQEGFAQFNAAKQRELAPPSMVGEYNFARSPAGGNFQGTYQQFVTARAAAGRAPAAPRPEPQPQPPVAVVDPATGKQVLVSREEALANRMTPAAAMESLSPKEIQKREAAFPQATSSVKGFETKSAAFIKDLKTLRDHPGLSSITGIAAGRLPGVTSAGRAAQALYDKVTAKGGFQGLQDMRDASKTGGALGNVSNTEGKQLIASFAAIDRRQDAKDVQAALDQAVADIQGSQTRMREAYDSTYSYKSAVPAAPAPGASNAQQERADANAAIAAGAPAAAVRARFKQNTGQEL